MYMPSVRRSMSVAQREGVAQNGEANSHLSPSQKLSNVHTNPYSSEIVAKVFRSFNLFAVAVIGFCLQRSNRSMDRGKSRCGAWKRVFFHFSLCFICGLLVGITPLVDFSSNPEMRHMVFRLDSSQAIGGPGNLTTHEIPLNGTVSQKSKLEIEDVDDGKVTTVLAYEHRKLLIVITPTYIRAFQAYYLNRLAHTLRLVPPPLLWIVVETNIQTSETASLLRKTGVMYRHLVSDKNITNIKDRGINQRNVALAHIEKHRLDGIVFFADDENVYSKDLFQQMRNIRRFGTWPVAVPMKTGAIGELEGPVCSGPQVIGWHTHSRGRLARKRFHIGMSGFAFNSTILWDPKRWNRSSVEPIRQLDTVHEGFQETSFIQQVIEDESQMEGITEGCSKVMVWNVHLESPDFSFPHGWVLHKYLDAVLPLQ